MELIKELNTNLAILADELNRKTINFSENCLYFGHNTKDVCNKSIVFLEQLLENTNSDVMTIPDVINATLNGLVVLDLMRVKQKHSQPLSESTSIRKYFKDDTVKADEQLMEQMSKLISEHGENALTLKSHYKDIFEHQELSKVVAELLEDYKLMLTKL